MWVFAVWLFLSALVGYFAHQKGHSGIVGFFLAALLSPLIGAIIIALLKPNQEVLEERLMAYEQHKRCPFCRGIVPGQAVKCQHCGSDLPN